MLDQWNVYVYMNVYTCQMFSVGNNTSVWTRKMQSYLLADELHWKHILYLECVNDHDLTVAVHMVSTEYIFFHLILSE